MAGPSFASVASTIKWPTISRSTRRAIGTTICGATGAMMPPRRTAPRMYQGRKAGTFGARAARLRPATARSSGRTTPSTKPTVNSRPCGSFKTPARRSAETSAGNFAASLSQCRTRAIVSSTRSSPGVGILAAVAAEVVLVMVGAWFVSINSQCACINGLPDTSMSPFFNKEKR